MPLCRLLFAQCKRKMPTKCDANCPDWPSGPGEPRFFAIENPAPGDWDIQILGTGAGPFTITAYGIDLDQPVGSIARMTGMASVGSHGGTALMIQSNGGVAFVPEPGAIALACSSMIVLLGYLRFRKSGVPR